jgi:hypothetical protein
MPISFPGRALATDTRGDVAMRIMPIVLIGLILIVLAIFWAVLL